MFLNRVTSYTFASMIIHYDRSQQLLVSLPPSEVNLKGAYQIVRFVMLYNQGLLSAFGVSYSESDYVRTCATSSRVNSFNCFVAMFKICSAKPREFGEEGGEMKWRAGYKLDVIITWAVNSSSGNSSASSRTEFRAL